jgi:hypothetical protein
LNSDAFTLTLSQTTAQLRPAQGAHNHFQSETGVNGKATPEGILIKPVTTKFIRGLRGSLKDKGVLKATMEDRKKEREL